MQKNKGFTLIELLGVIIIISIISIISIPIIMNVMNSIDKSSFTQDTKGILRAIKIYIDNEELVADDDIVYDIKNGKIYDGDEVVDVEFNGKIHGTGQVKINNDGDILIYYSNAKYCAYKNYSNSDIKVSKGNCESLNALVCQKPTITINPESWSQIKTLEINGTNASCEPSYQIYRKEENDQIKIFEHVYLKTSGLITQNDVFVKAYGNGIKNIEESDELHITTIDNTPPTLIQKPSINVDNENGNYIVTVTASAIDEQSGVPNNGYEFAIKAIDGSYTEWKSSGSNFYEFTSEDIAFDPHKMYQAKARAKNNSWLNTKNANLDLNDREGISPELESDRKSLIGCPTPTITVNPTNWSQEDKTVIIDFGNSLCEKSYTVLQDGIEIRSEIVTNSEITAIVTEDNAWVVAANTMAESVSSSAPVKIDRTAPNNVILSKTNQTTNSITVTASATDPESGGAGFSYRYAIKNQNDSNWSWTSYSNNNQHTFNNLITGTYDIKVEAKNEAGLSTESPLLSNVTLDPCPVPTIILNAGNQNISSGTWTNKNVAATIEGTNSCGTLYYALTANPTNDDWVQYTDSISFNVASDHASSHTLIARSYDGINYSEATTTHSINIDKKIPEIDASTSLSENTITLSGTIVDSDSRINPSTITCGYGIDNYNTPCTITLNGNNITSTISVEDTSKTYHFRICASDNANNQKCYTTIEIGDAVLASGYVWNIIGKDSNNLTLLMYPTNNFTNSSKSHCDRYNWSSNPCYLFGNGTYYYSYRWNVSYIKTYLNGDFYNGLTSDIKDNLVPTNICIDTSDYNGYTEEEITKLGTSCNSYENYNVRLITISEYHNLSPVFDGQTYPADSNKIPKLDNIQRTSDAWWLYGSQIGSWWTMNKYGTGSSTYAYYVQSDGSYTTTGGDSSLKVRPVIVLPRDTILESASRYTITFESNGGSSVDSQTLFSVEKVIRPTNPTYTGYAFEGWYTDSNFTTLYDFDTPVTSNLTLYAKWRKLDEYTVTFESNGGSYVPSQTVLEGSYATEPNPKPTRYNYSFVGWYSNSSLTTQYYFSTPVTSNITLYAKWESCSTIRQNCIDSCTGNARSGCMSACTNAGASGCYSACQSAVCYASTENARTCIQNAGCPIN